MILRNQVDFIAGHEFMEVPEVVLLLLTVTLSLVDVLSDRGEQTEVIHRHKRVLIVSDVADVGQRDPTGLWFALIAKEIEL